MAELPFADLSLARRLERAEGSSCAGFVETRREIEPRSGAAVFRQAGALAMFDGPESPLTQTFGLGVFDPVGDSDLDAIEAFYRERSTPVQLEVCPLAGVELTARLVGRGYAPIEMSSVLYRDLTARIEIEGSRDEALRVRAADHDEANLWAETAARGWSEFGDCLELLRFAATVNTRREGAHSFLVEIDGEAIAAGALFLDADGTILLAGASTVPSFRRRGAQRALLEHRLEFARERGSDLVMMVAEPGSTSQRNAERNGFRIAYTRTKWRLDHPPA